MFSELDKVSGGDGVIDASLIEELSRNTPANIQALRRHERLTVSGAMQALPGNLSADVSDAVDGSAVDVSAGGCMGVFERPLRVGDVYRIRLDSKEARMPIAYARCVRVRLLRESAFEAGFSFFSPVDVKAISNLAA
jgi:PilZ domain